MSLGNFTWTPTKVIIRLGQVPVTSNSIPRDPSQPGPPLGDLSSLQGSSHLLSPSWSGLSPLAVCMLVSIAVVIGESSPEGACICRLPIPIAVLLDCSGPVLRGDSKKYLELPYISYDNHRHARGLALPRTGSLNYQGRFTFSRSAKRCPDILVSFDPSHQWWVSSSSLPTGTWDVLFARNRTWLCSPWVCALPTSPSSC